MNYEETLAYLYERLPMFQRIGKAAFKKDLSNTLKLCEALGNPQKKFKSIHIAGTNGKGSTAHSLASIFQEAGYKTGLYTSPHLKSFTERIKIDGSEVESDYVVEFVEKHKSLIEEVRPSFFEITVVMAFDYFAKKEVDIAMIEVGMGGRFDSTNVILPELSIITQIGLDHMEYLGPDLPTIAFEKAGIIKDGIPVVISVDQKETRDVFLKKAGECRSEIHFAEKNISISRIGEGRYNVESDLLSGELETALKGNYQIRNLPGIVKAVELMKEMGYDISLDNFLNGLKNVISNTGLKGRWQKLSEGPFCFCDTGHNEDAIRDILKQIRQYQYQKLYMVLGFVNDKKIDDIMAILPKEAHYIFCKPNIPRARDAENIRELASSFNLESEVVNDVNEAILKARKLASRDDFIFIGGSTFVVAEIEEL